jgi:hypothetical protein
MHDPREVKLGDLWGFSPMSFDRFRRELELRSDKQWRFSGESELVAMNAFLAPNAATVDFDSIVSGPLTEPDLSVTTKTLAQAIERLGQQFDDGSEDPDYGLGEILSTNRDSSKSDSIVGRIGIGTAGGVAAALVRNALGLP